MPGDNAEAWLDGAEPWLVQAVARANLTHDRQFGPIFAGQLRVVRANAQAAERIEAAAERLTNLSPEALKQNAAATAREAGQHLARQFPWRVAAACGASFVAGAVLVGVAWGLAPTPYAGLSLDRETAGILAANGGTLAPAAAKARRGQAAGGEYGDLRVWLRPPPPQ